MVKADITILTIIDDHCQIGPITDYIRTHNLYSKTICISTSPNINNQLVAQGINTLNSKSIFSDDDHYEGLKLSNKIIKDLEEKLNKIIVNKFQYSIILNYLFRIQFFINHLAFNHLYLKNIFKYYPTIDTLITFGNHNFKTNSPKLSNLENAYSYLAEELTKLNNFKNIKIEIKKQSHNNFQFGKFILNIIIRFRLKTINFNNYIFVTSQHRNLIHEIKTSKNNKICLISLNESPSFLEQSLLKTLILFLPLFLRHKIYQKKYNHSFDYVIPMEVVNNSKLQNQLWKSFNSFLSNLNEIKIENSRIEKAIIEKSINGIIPWVIQTNTASELIENIFSKAKNIKIFSIENTGIACTIGEIAKNKNLAAVLISHGSHASPKDINLEQEYIQHGKGLIISKYPFTVAQSKLALDFIKKYSSNSIPITCGPIIWGKKNANNSNFRKSLNIADHVKIITHASTQKPRESSRFVFYETVDEYVANLVDIVNITKEIKNCYLIIKFRENRNLTADDLVIALPKGNHYKIEINTPFLEVLNETDILISYSSTTMEEAIQYNVPVIEYNHAKRFSFLGLSDQTNIVKNADYNNLKDVIEFYMHNNINKEEFNKFKINETMNIFNCLNNILK